jgi:hypothetical protein
LNWFCKELSQKSKTPVSKYFLNYKKLGSNINVLKTLFCKTIVIAGSRKKYKKRDTSGESEVLLISKKERDER